MLKRGRSLQNLIRPLLDLLFFLRATKPCPKMQKRANHGDRYQRRTNNSSIKSYLVTDISNTPTNCGKEKHVKLFPIWIKTMQPGYTLP
jgi:hypothetical protein